MFGDSQTIASSTDCVSCFLPIVVDIPDPVSRTPSIISRSK
jgi:hypothetical protein